RHRADGRARHGSADADRRPRHRDRGRQDDLRRHGRRRRARPARDRSLSRLTAGARRDRAARDVSVAAPTAAVPRVQPLLEIENLAVGYDGMRALQDVWLRADAGTIVALVGANGAGKTSLLRSISGLVSAERGSI